MAAIPRPKFNFPSTPYPVNETLIPIPNQRVHCIFRITSTRPIFRSPYSAFGVPNSKISSIYSIFPGGNWWNLGDSGEEDTEAAKPVTVWTALNRMWNLMGEDKWIIYLGLGGLVAAAVSEISIPSILAASIFSVESRASSVFHRNSRMLIMLCIASGICSGLRSGCFDIANTILVKRFREALYSSLIFQDMSFFDEETVGGLTSRLGSDCQQLSKVLGNNIHLIVRNSIQGIGALINLLILSWPLTSPTLVICFVLSAIFSIYGKFQKKAAKLTQEFNASANSTAQETFSMIRTARVYGAEVEEFQRYKIWLDKLAFISIQESMAYGFWNMSFQTLYRSTQVIAVAVGGIFIMSGHVSAEQLTKYVLYCEWFIYATWRVVDNLSSLLQSIGASEMVFQLMDLMPSDHFLSEGMKLQRLVGHIQFVNVSFHYPSRTTEPILNHVNLSIQAKEAVAIVGSSGSGKSTLVNLILQLYEPSNGQIYIDSFPLKDLDIRWLRENIGLVRQEPHLFNIDIKSNISYGCPREITDEDIELAAKQAYAHEFISSLPNGYETIVDDGLLSAGEKQRIAIARAILRDPPILILDEATSALDSESEQYIKRLLHALTNDNKRKRTVIVIAHRLSTIKTVNKIVVMDKGRIVEVGNHAELLEKDGLYAQLVKIQGKHSV